MNDLADRVLRGELRALSRLLTMVERGDPAAAPAMEQLDPQTGRAYTVGITGPPGVGKSTLVDRLTEHLRKLDLTVGILAVDPTSPFTGGALLGDRIRMQRHYLDDGVFMQRCHSWAVRRATAYRQKHGQVAGRRRQGRGAG